MEYRHKFAPLGRHDLIGGLGYRWNYSLIHESPLHGDAPLSEPSVVFGNGYLDVDVAVVVNDKPIAYMDIQYATDALDRRILQQVGLTLGVFAVGILLAFLLASRLHRLISSPISGLADSMAAVADRQDYSMRVAGTGKDEVGTLVQAFNQMLEQIQSRDAALYEAKVAAEAGSRAWRSGPAATGFHQSALQRGQIHRTR